MAAPIIPAIPTNTILKKYPEYPTRSTPLVPFGIVELPVADPVLRVTAVYASEFSKVEIYSGRR
jgi:hypothetical protein